MCRRFLEAIYVPLPEKPDVLKLLCTTTNGSSESKGHHSCYWLHADKDKAQDNPMVKPSSISNTSPIQILNLHLPTSFLKYPLVPEWIPKVLTSIYVYELCLKLPTSTSEFASEVPTGIGILPRSTHCPLFRSSGFQTWTRTVSTYTLFSSSDVDGLRGPRQTRWSVLNSN